MVRDPAWPLASSRCLLSPPLQCEDAVCGLSPSQATLGELKPPQRQSLAAFLQLVRCGVQGGRPGPEGAGSTQQLLPAAYFLVSALAGTGDSDRDRERDAAGLLRLPGRWCPRAPSQQQGEGKE